MAHRAGSEAGMKFLLFFFAKRRFNYGDVFAASYCVSLLAEGNFLIAASVFIFGLLLSVSLEELASRKQ